MNESECSARLLEMATNYVRERVEPGRENSKNILSVVQYRSNIQCGADMLAELTCLLDKNGRICSHFHPDHIDQNGSTVAASLLASGKIMSQFESGISNGRVDTSQGGFRDTLEARLFGEDYVKFIQGRPEMRVKYGALSLIGSNNGPAPRFGSCYFVFKQEVMKRSTFCYGDSYNAPDELGLEGMWEVILSKLFNDSYDQDGVLGMKLLRPPELYERMKKVLEGPVGNNWSFPALSNLNSYIEAQIHGPLTLEQDVEAIVIDPSFQNTDVFAAMKQIADKYNVKMVMHHGYSLHVKKVPNSFRGPSMPRVASLVCQFASSSTDNVFLTPFLIGQTRHEITKSLSGELAKLLRAECHDLGAPTLTQLLKFLWHCLCNYGCAPVGR